MEPDVRPATTGLATRTAVAILVIVAAVGAAFVLRRQLLMVLPMCVAGEWDLCLGTFNGVGLVTFAAFPFAGLAVWALAQRRSAAGIASAWRWSFAEVAIVYGTAPWVWITMLPGSGAGVVSGRVSLVPLRDLATMDNGQIVGNLLVFAALGFFAPLRFRWLASVPRMLALGTACSILIEVSQYVLQLDRVSSIDDVLLNGAGAGIAALVSRPLWHVRPNVASVPPRPAPAPAH